MIASAKLLTTRCGNLFIFYLGFKGSMVVAVKTLKDNAGERERLDLVQELQVMKSLEPHPHVVKLLGCCSERGMRTTL